MRSLSAGARYIVPLFFLRSRSRSLVHSATKKNLPFSKHFFLAGQPLPRYFVNWIKPPEFFHGSRGSGTGFGHVILFTGGKVSSTSFLPAPAPPASRRVVARRGFQLTHSRLRRRQFEWRPPASAAIGQERLVSQHRVVSQHGTRLRFRYGHRQCGNADSRRGA